MDAVEAATRSMEDSGVLNAGCGSCLTEDGNVELDAMIMDGKTLNTGKLMLLLLSIVISTSPFGYSRGYRSAFCLQW